MSDLNDCERKGLPADFDLLEQSIGILKKNPHDTRRMQLLRDVMIRVLPQVRNNIRRKDNGNERFE